MTSLAADDPRHGMDSTYKKYRCRCTHCRKAHADCTRAYNHRTGRHRPLAAYLAEREPWQHGTLTGYMNHGCRCDGCRNASTAYHRARKSAGYSVSVCPGCGGEMGAVAQLCRSCSNAAREPDHGTESRYNSGCRCDECRQAATVARRRRRQANPEQDAAYQRAYNSRRRAKATA